MAKDKKVGKAVLINPNGEVLLLMRGKTAPTRALTWDLPGGIVPEGEDVESSTKREIEEETGLQIDNLNFALDMDQPWGFHWTLYHADVDPQEIRVSWEHDEFIWHNPNNLKELSDMPVFLRIIVEKVMKTRD